MLLWDYTWEEIRGKAPRSVAVQPVASVEQHGPHLPLGTDSLIADEFSRRLQARMTATGYPALFLPLMPYGKSNEHIDCPGTITYSAQTYLQVLMDIGRSCARAGFPKLVFLSAHGGNREVLDVAARELRIETGMGVFVMQPSLVPREREKMGCALNGQEMRLGIHAGRTETSAVMRIKPETVREDQIRAAYPRCFQETRYLDFSGRVSVGWMTRDISQTGVVGNPVGADPQEGERWLANVTEEVYRAFEEIRRFEFQTDRPGATGLV